MIMGKCLIAKTATIKKRGERMMDEYAFLFFGVKIEIFTEANFVPIKSWNVNFCLKYMIKIMVIFPTDNLLHKRANCVH